MIPFNLPYFTGDEIKNLSQAIKNNHLAGDGPFTKLCSKWMEENLNVKKALLTQSCTSALEMTAMLIGIQSGDEVIMPSFTFVSTANAFVLRGGVPVFVDIRSDTKNIDENLIVGAITSKTKAIVVVHYAGIACEMDIIMEIANKYKLIVIEDAAQALLSEYKGRRLGSIGHFGCLSFHETKNIQCGEGGALLINSSDWIERAEIIREKGTNRAQFFRGKVDKYTWRDIGSSFLPSEITASFLWAQLCNAELITSMKLDLYEKYKIFFEDKLSHSKLPYNPPQTNHNAHFYYLLMDSIEERTEFISKMRKGGVSTTFHYIPLHKSDAGIKYGRYIGKMNNTNFVSDALVRLPVYPNLDIETVLLRLSNYF